MNGNLLVMTAEQFAKSGKAWVEAMSAVLNSLIAQFGILAAAALGVWKSISTKAELTGKIQEAKQEISERLDRQGQRIDTVALAVPNVNGTPITEPKPLETSKP